MASQNDPNTPAFRQDKLCRMALPKATDTSIADSGPDMGQN